MLRRKFSNDIKIILTIFLLFTLTFWLFKNLITNNSLPTTSTTTIPTTTSTTTTTKIPEAKKYLTREVFIDMKSGESMLWFSEKTVEDVRAAMKIWEEKTNHIINFEEVRAEQVADVTIKFSESFNASSPGKKIIGEAYVYFGEVRGIIYIQPSAISCRNQVRAMHELGHIIGLNHSTDYKSVMYPIESCAQNITEEDAKIAINLIKQFL
jgi:predicted Zn-dependent protease